MPASLAARTNASPSRISVLPASIDSASAPAACIASIVATPTTGTSKRMSCVGFATLTTRVPGAGERAGARDHGVGAFHRLDGDDGPSFTTTVWPTSSAGDRVGDRGSRTRSPPHRVGRRARASARPACASRSASSAVESISVMPCSSSTSATAAMSASVFFASSRVEHRQQREIRQHAAEELDVLDLPGHHRARDAGALERLDALAELAERDPVNVVPPSSRASASRSGDASPSIATTVTSCPSCRAARRTRNGNVPLPAMRPMGTTVAYSHVDRASSTPPRRPAQDDAALGRGDEVARDSATSGAAQRRVALDQLERAARVVLQQLPVRAAQLADRAPALKPRRARPIVLTP